MTPSSLRPLLPTLAVAMGCSAGSAGQGSGGAGTTGGASWSAAGGSYLAPGGGGTPNLVPPPGAGGTGLPLSADGGSPPPPGTPVHDGYRLLRGVLHERRLRRSPAPGARPTRVREHGRALLDGRRLLSVVRPLHQRLLRAHPPLRRYFRS
jgi:hypothetical protein